MEQHKVGEYDKASRSPKDPRKIPPPKNPIREDELDFNSGPEDAEIAPGKLDREETNPDRSGTDFTKGHEPYEFKTQIAHQSFTQVPRNHAASREPSQKKTSLQDLENHSQDGSPSGSIGSSTKGTYDHSLRGSSGGIDGEKSAKRPGVNLGIQK